MPRIILLIAVAVALSAILIPAGRADAHANQIRSSPAPDSQLDEAPDRVIVWFSEPVEARLSTVRVLNSRAVDVDNGDSARSPTEPTALVVTLPPLENGTYTVVWRNVSSVDGHRVVGSFRFAVGEPLSAAAAVEGLEQPLLQSVGDPWFRGAFFLGALTMTGALIFDLMVIRQGLAGSDGSAITDYAVRRLVRAERRLLLAGFGLTAFGLLALLVQQAAAAFEVGVFQVAGEPVRTVLLESDWGAQWLWKSGLAVLVVTLATLAARSAPGEPKAQDCDEDGEEPVAFTDTLPGLAAVASSAALLFVTSLGSHNAAVPEEARMLALISDYAHLLAAATWVGGLLLLATGLVATAKGAATDGARADVLRAFLPRFSTLAFISAGVLVITGIFAGYMQVTVPAATNTPYGWGLVTKIALTVPLFGLAAVNSHTVARRLLRGDAALTRLARTVRWEAAVAVLIIAAAGWLAGLEPARQYAARNGIGVSDSVTHSDFAESTQIDLSITPGGVGQNSVQVTLTDRRGAPLLNASDVRVRLRFLEEDLGEALRSLSSDGGGVWSSGDFSIAIGGVYQAEVVVVRPDAFDARTSFRFDATPPAGAADAIRPTREVTWTLFGLELLLIGGVLMLSGAPVLRGVRGPSRAIAAPGAALVVVGLALVLNASVLKAGFPRDRFNPFPINTESIALGRIAFVNTCASCHGLEGLGDGPQAAGLNSPPADLAVHVPLHADGDLFGFIRDGIPGTAMPGQEGRLSTDEMWRLVNYLRTFE